MLTVADIRLDQSMTWHEQGPEPAEDAFLIAVTYGKCVYRIGQEKLIAEKGDFLYIPPGCSFQGKSIPTVFHEKLVVRMSADPRREPLLPLLARRTHAISKAGAYAMLVGRLRLIHKEWTERAAFYDVRAGAVLLEVLTLWSRELERREPTSRTLESVESMKRYIQTNHREKITKEELGACIRRSPNHAASLFSRVTGQTISEYVNAVRIQTAVYMLSESLLTIAEISEYLGYRDVSYFQRVFKRLTGSTPHAYARGRGV